MYFILIGKEKFIVGNELVGGCIELEKVGFCVKWRISWIEGLNLI